MGTLRERVLHNLLIHLKSLAEYLSAQVCEESTRGKERAMRGSRCNNHWIHKQGTNCEKSHRTQALGGVLRGSCLGLREISSTPEAALVSPKILRYAFKSKRTTNLFCKKSDSKYLELGRPSGLSVTTTPSQQHKSNQEPHVNRHGQIQTGGRSLPNPAQEYQVT